MTVTELPRPAANPTGTRMRRWIPRRAGILNVWRYYDEVFEFHQGRLLLRGQNGSGKSKALELLLPFLFDASLRANRLSTFGTGDRTMHWNLMGDGTTGATRVGYVWIEFGFADDPDRWFSCGARLAATSRTNAVGVDYFTTELRVGVPGGLSLVNDSGQPLTRAVLEEALGEHGVVHPTAGDYRAAIRAALFPGISEPRYDALITALLQLRMPKLSQRLDPALLSTLLSRALPPLDEQEIEELAEGFERLDAQRERIGDLEDEVAAARTLAAQQRTYAQRVLRGAAAELISATTELDNTTRDARRSAEEHERVAALLTRTEAGVTALQTALGNAEARITGLTDSEAYKQGRELDRLRRQAREAAGLAHRVRVDAARLRGDADGDQRELRAAVDAQARQDRVVRAAGEDARHAAVRAALEGAYQELAGQLAAEPGRTRTLLRAVVRSRRDVIAEVERAISRHETAVDRRTEAERELDRTRDEYAGASERRDGAAEERSAALADLQERLAAWAAGCREIAFADPDGLADLAESETAVLDAIDAVARIVLDEITRAEAAAEADLRGVRTERVDVAVEIERLSEQRELPPPAPYTRTADRAALAGAPLWRLVDFAPSLPAEQHAPIEAALQASGLLDAWITADGRVSGHDVLAEPEALPPVPGASLADVLVVEPGTDVDVQAVRRLLSAVAVGDRAAAAVAADGTWRMGTLTGSWGKEHAEHIGAPARERARQARLAELGSRLSELDARAGGIEGMLSALAGRRDAVAAERADRPSHGELAAATGRLTLAESVVTAANGVLRRAIDALTGREAAVTAGLRALTSLAAEHAMPTERGALDTLAAAVRVFDEQAGGWLDAYDRLGGLRHGREVLAEQARRSAEAVAVREEEAIEAEQRRDALATTLTAVESTIGADYRDTLEELARVREELAATAGDLKRTQDEAKKLTGRLGGLAVSRSADAQRREAAAGVRDAAAARFRHLATGVLGADSGASGLPGFRDALGGSDGIRAALDSARRVASVWPTVPYARTNVADAQSRLAVTVQACRTALSGRADLDLESDEGVQLFTASIDGIRVGAVELHELLTDDLRRARGEITDRERDLFDRTLTGDTRRHLAARIRQATELVDGMNARLEGVRTASKIAVRLVWEVSPELPPGTKAARDLLLRDPVRLTDEDRASLHRFFRDRIEQARAEDSARTWAEQLAQVLDYTAWHRFVVKLDRADGAGWQLLTRKLHGALSGGEKAIALHLPLFAAVAAHYQTMPEAPRIILLDEVFVGVDSANRGQVFGLLAALDLDLMLTSDHEWCTYAELTGIGIHQLITGDGDDAVTTARFTWTGRDLIPDIGSAPNASSTSPSGVQGDGEEKP